VVSLLVRPFKLLAGLLMFGCIFTTRFPPRGVQQEGQSISSLIHARNALLMPINGRKKRGEIGAAENR